jgi:hypothetical protein
VSTTTTSKYLATYLNDHLAGSTAGLELVKRAASENAGTPLGDFLTQLTDEISEDRAALEELMDSLGVGADHKKLAAAWVGEKVGRLKPNAQLRGYSPLSPLVELEALSLGIEGKRLMWVSLQRIADDYGLPAERFAALEARASDQRERLEQFRGAVAERALRA